MYSSFSYAASTRRNSPSYDCTNTSDKFTVDSSAGNGKLYYPIGLMTIDELSYAGGESNTDLTAPYAWYYTNANGESITGTTPTRILSPNSWGGSFSTVMLCYGSGIQQGGLFNGGVNDSYVVRPSVSLKSCNLISGGDGTANNPYVIKTDGSSC